MSRYADKTANGTWGMATSASPLKNSCNSLWAANLKDLFNRAKINTKIKARCRDNTLESAIAKARLSSIA
jgi:hypothetical protein